MGFLHFFSSIDILANSFMYFSHCIAAWIFLCSTLVSVLVSLSLTLHLCLEPVILLVWLVIFPAVSPAVFYVSALFSHSVGRLTLCSFCNSISCPNAVLGFALFYPYRFLFSLWCCFTNLPFFLSRHPLSFTILYSFPYCWPSGLSLHTLYRCSKEYAMTQQSWARKCLKIFIVMVRFNMFM